jgi:3',5'-cyclic AMP phosphodiesterase CpdA
MILAQLSDTHVVRPGAKYFGADSARYLAEALAALQTLVPRPDAVIVTGDLVHRGSKPEYARFVRIMAGLDLPYYVVPGNHDDRDRMRAVLAPETFGSSAGTRVRYTLEAHGVRLIGLDATGEPSFPNASLDADSLDWFEATLAAAPLVPTIVAVHQPPFRTGLVYLDVFRYEGAARFRRALERHPNVGRVLCGHIHCVRTARLGSALALSGPSTAPQIVPELFGRRLFALRREAPGFAVHAWDPARGFTTTIHRRDPATGVYAATEAYPAAGAAFGVANARV